MIDILQRTKEVLRVVPNPRIQNILVRRFGLANGQRETLESIGQDYGITRERVRQIEEDGFKYLKNNGAIDELKPAFDLVQQYLSQHGDLRREDKIFEDLYQNIKKIKKPVDSLTATQRKDFSKHQGSFLFILFLGPVFNKYAETEKFFSGWTINSHSLKRAQNLIDFLIDYLADKKEVVAAKKLYSVAKNKEKNLCDKAIFSYLDTSKRIFQNHFGDYGLFDWPEVSPRGVKDKAYLVLKKENQPLHFRQITELINQLIGDKKTAYVQTVHNELIKDPRFVLIGRGIYALSDWGYEPGTVLDMITAIIKTDGPQTKDQLLKRVLAKRLVKENTVLINLQNRNSFIRGKNGRYNLV